MSEELEPLDHDVLAVLNELGPVRDVPGVSRDRIWSAVEARVAMTPALSNAGARRVPSHALERLPHRGGFGGWIGRNPWIALSGAIVVGGALGAAARGSPEARVVTVERASGGVPPAAPASVAATAWTPVAVSESSVAVVASSPVVPHAVASATVVVGTGQQLAAESALLDIARTAIAHGEADHAIAAVDRHAASFPSGMLREEREALGVKALVLAGRGDDARARTARFRARYPDSLFLPALESTLRSIP